MENENYLNEIKKKSLSGVGSLIRRQIFIKIIVFFANILLARILAPQIFGIYAIVSFVVQFFSTFGDIGLGAALIQKKGELSKEELSTTFWFQQILVWIVAGLTIAAAPFALKIYPDLPPAGVWLIRAMAFAFLFTSLKTVPAILLERNLNFNRIAWVDIAESLVFQAATISFALAGFEVWSFVIAAIIRGIFGAVFIYALSAWRPTLDFNFKSVKALVKFGLPYQGSSVMSFLKDAVAPLFIGAYAGAAAVGYVNWARTFAFAPLMLTESFGRVAFPAFSRIQHDKALLKKVVERSIRCITLVMFPLTVILLTLGTEITRVIFTEKWMPGITAFYFYCTSPGMIGIFLPLYSAIISLGKSRVLLVLTIMLILMEWGLGVPFIIYFGFNGVAMTQPLTATLFSWIYVLILKREGIDVKVIPNILWQLMTALFTGLLIKIFMSFTPVNGYTLFIAAFSGLAVYVILMLILRRKLLDEFIEYAKNIVARGG